MTSGELIQELEANGWQLDRIRGSHHVYKHPEFKNPVVVPHPRKDLGKGLVNSIRKAAGLK